MDAASVVALLVLADQHVVLTGDADPVRAGLTGTARAAGRPHRGQDLDHAA